MPLPLLPSDTTYTMSRITDILRRGRYIPKYIGDSRDPAEFGVLRTEVNRDWGTSDNTAARRQAATNQCREYCAIIANVSDHLERLDDAYSNLIQCNFKPSDPDSVVRNTCHRLRRLPATPPAFDKLRPTGDFSRFHDAYFIRDSSHTWENLKVVRFVDTNVLRLALQIEMAEKSWWGTIFTLFINTISCLLNAALALPTVDQSPTEEIILQAFLWTSWQRAVMLHFSYSLGYQLALGFEYGRNRDLAVDLIPSSQKAFRFVPGEVETPGYMCNWAFNLICSDRAAVGLDFRTFHERYKEVFGGLPPRCITSAEHGSRQCAGDSPGSCARFKGMKTKDQSAHAEPCKGQGQCKRLFWNEYSFRNQHGARAVLLEADDWDNLTYCTASESTMAISHVWSHGQGGRPEFPKENGTGFNSCLHRRYSKIAQDFGCNSYWMDTPCIPQDHELRKEAIENINSVFAFSKVTLVCDVDLMGIDVSNRTIKVLESLLAVLLVCDWNVRAWTFLEAIRGRNNIHLLCKHDEVVSLREALETVNREGDITLGNLFLTAQHLIPAQGIPPGGTRDPVLIQRARGFVSIEEASCLLSHRHATHKNDEVIIWSLLCSDKVEKTAIDLWKSRIGRGLHTGFLMSNHPRIGYQTEASKGFGWAPSGPGMPDDIDSKTKVFFADDGYQSGIGLIRPEGFRADWLVSELVVTSPRDQSPTGLNVRYVRSQYLTGYQWGALVRAGQASIVVPVQYRGDSDGILVGVIGSNSMDAWHWICVYEWDVSIPLPHFQRKEILLE